MSQSGSQAAAFFRELTRHRLVWYVRDDRGSPAPKTDSEQRVFPYWSSQARAKRAADIWGGGLRADSVSLEAWRSRALPELAEDGYLIGINWTGPRLVGWELTVAEVLSRLDHVQCPVDVQGRHQVVDRTGGPGLGRRSANQHERPGYRG